MVVQKNLNDELSEDIFSMPSIIEMAKKYVFDIGYFNNFTQLILGENYYREEIDIDFVTKC